MSQSDKSAYYQVLKKAGVEFTKHYREYSTEELAEAFRELQLGMGLDPDANPPAADEPDDVAPPPPLLDDAFPDMPELPPTAADAVAAELAERQSEAEFRAAVVQAALAEAAAAAAAAPPVTEKNLEEMPGERLNSQDDEPIRTDDQGRVWYQEEVLKPAFPKPRGRRVLQYQDTGTQTKTVKTGDYTESFEIAGDRQGVTAQIKITLPSYQVGQYRDPRFPFMVHTYNGVQGFDLFEVQEYYGGSELVPVDIKRMYVENVLCYDVRTVIRAIQTEFRQLQLQGKV